MAKKSFVILNYEKTAERRQATGQIEKYLSGSRKQMGSLKATSERHGGLHMMAHSLDEVFLPWMVQWIESTPEAIMCDLLVQHPVFLPFLWH